MLLASVAGAAACHEEGDIRVEGLTFEGNSEVPTEDLRAVLATRVSGKLPWSPAAIFDRAEFERDLERVRRLYQDRGYPDARVSTVDVDLNDKQDGVKLRIVIDEGLPLLVEDVRFNGFDVLTQEQRQQLENGPVQPNTPRDRGSVGSLQVQAVNLLHDNGYAQGKVDVSEARSAEGSGVVITLNASAGPRSVFGPISIVGAATLADSVITRYISFKPGDLYRQNRVVQSERRLGSLEILRFADIDAKVPEDASTTEIPVTVTVAEDPPRRLELSGGYGSEDRFRGSVEWSHLNFLGNARRLTSTSKWSSIDRGLRLSFTQPYFLAQGLSLDANVSTWWTSEQIYTSNAHGGRLGVAYRFGARRAERRAPSDLIRAAYVYEALGYTVRPEALEDLTNVDELLALGLNPSTGEGHGTKTALVFDYERTSTDSLVDPRRGYGLSLHYEEAKPWLGGTFDYREIMAEGRGYVPLGRPVIAVRARVGTTAAERESDVPFSERYFLGGASNLRGWGRYQVSPDRNGVPIGGRTVVDGSLELRVPVRGPLGAVVFVDAGNVWNGSFEATRSALKSDVGIGLRYGTPVGLIRADLGVQLNPIEGLVVEGEVEPRPWRIHFSIGQAF